MTLIFLVTLFAAALDAHSLAEIEIRSSYILDNYCRQLQLRITPHLLLSTLPTSTNNIAVLGMLMTPIATVRPLIIGSSTGLEAPYPLQMEGKVIKGFGRGSKQLGIPTANLPVDDSLTPWIADIESGVYFGWASLRLPPSRPNQATTSSDTTTTTTAALKAHSRFSLYPMVMSIGYDKFFKNTTR